MTTATYTLPRRPRDTGGHAPPGATKRPARGRRRWALGYVLIAGAWMLGTRALLDTWLARGLIGPDAYGLALLAGPVVLVAISAILLPRQRAGDDPAEEWGARIADALPGPCALIDRDGVIAYANPAFRRALSLTCPARARLPLASVLAPYLAPGQVGALLPEAGARTLRLATRPGAPGGHAIRLRRIDGGAAAPSAPEDPHLGWILTDADTQPPAAAEDALKARALEITGEGVVISDLRAPDMPLIYVNRAFQDITGYASAEVLGRNLRFLQGSDRLQPEIAVLRERLEKHQPVTVTLRNYRRDGTLFWNEMRLAPARDPHGALSHGAHGALSRDTPTHYIGILRDVTAERLAAEKLELLAFRDAVTGLPNRAGFLRALADVLAATPRAKSGAEVLLLALDVAGHDAIVGAFGEAAGDALLAGIAERLRAHPGGILAGRLRDHAFGLVLELADPADAPAAAAVLAALHPPFQLPDGDVAPEFSVGMARGRRDTPPATLLRQALAALDQARHAPPHLGVPLGVEGPVQEGHAQPGAAAAAAMRRRVGLRQDLRGAVDAGDFALHLQPVVALASGAWVGAEALARWRHPVFGLQPPGLFLPVSEQTGQILEIDAWALRHAAALAKRLEAGRLEAGRLNGECQPPPHPPLAISVNLSAPRLRHPGLAGLLENILRETGADPATLKLEIAEPVLAEAMARDAAGMIAELRRLRALGFGIVIDDFGAGAASLSNLHRLPVTDIKIDPGFIRDCADSPYHQLVIGAFVAIGGALGIDVTAKGVARDAQLRGLEKLGVRRAQGFLFGAPIDADAFSAQAFAAEAGEARMGPPLFFPRADGIAAPGT